MVSKYGPGAVILPYYRVVAAGESSDTLKNNFYFNLFSLEDNISINGFTSYITNNMGANSKMKLTVGVWAANAYGEPSTYLKTLLDEKEITITSTEIGAHELAIIDFDSYALSPGAYFIGARYKPNSGDTIQYLSGISGGLWGLDSLPGDLTSSPTLYDRFYYTGEPGNITDCPREDGCNPTFGLRVG